MSVLNDGQAFTKGILGIRVNRATAALPQTTAAAIFTVATGRVAVLAITGEVTTIIQTQANATKLTFDPTDAGATQNLCATTDITADAVGTVYSITGTPATVLQDALNFLPPNLGLAGPVILKPGSVLLDCAASNTGSVKWSLWYVPLDDGATVTAA
jgi:hypothetical protein